MLHVCTWSPLAALVERTRTCRRQEAETPSRGGCGEGSQLTGDEEFSVG
jgi:hypothetical protein